MESTNPKRERYAVPLPKLGPVPFPMQSKPKRDRIGKQQALMLAAANLFADRGYEATTTREIAARAGCAEGLIHRYFKGKAGLLFALIQNRVSRPAVHLHRHPPSTGKFEEDFVRLVESEVDRVWEDRDFFKMIVPRALLDPTIGKLLGGGATSPQDALVIERLKRHRKWECRSQEEIERLAELIEVLGFHFGFLQPVVFGQDRLQARRMATAIAAMLIHSL
jgi:AcrR family transcriptional regulator